MNNNNLIEKFTRKFYERFKKEYNEFLHCVLGIADQRDRERYTLLMLNRLMFLYFIQQKGMLAGDRNYLQNRLRKGQEFRREECGGCRDRHCPRPYSSLLDGQDPFFSFYRCFLLKLFHEGLSKRECLSEIEQLLGKVPYLKSDLFAIHALERKYPDIRIPDSAFEKLFDFFQKYDWHLDDRSGEKRENEINPDVLGSIFEQFINQKERGAYYTKKDVTEYISKNTIIPSIFGTVEKRCPDAFCPTGPVWSLLRNNLNKYTYVNVVKYDITCINDVITYNLDICKFVCDVIVSCERSDLLLAFYESIEATTVLDPTCGSGAFLFAALDILYPLYEACLVRMHAMANENDQLNVHIQAPLRYFIVKSIITKNLYGVDLMEEAVEVCKLRLFLKLIAQVDKPEDIEPLSEIDFNVLVGNALVGSAGLEEVCQSVATCGEGTGQELVPNLSLQPRPFHWWVAFYEIMKSGGFSVIIGNPPYVEYNAATFPYTLSHFETLACANLYPCVVERSYQLLSPQGYLGMILPLAAFATKNMTPFIESFYNWFPCSWLSFYHFRPSMLFSGGKVASIPTAIFLAKAAGPERRFSTNLIKWATDKRDQLFSRLTYCPVTVTRDGENRHYYPKFGHTIENTIMEKILRHQRVETFLAKAPNDNTMWYRSAGGLYWKVFVNFPWPYETTSNKQCSFQQSYERDVFVALFNSSLFWWYYTVTFDSFNLKNYMLFGFRFSYPQDTTLIESLRLCTQSLMSDFRANAQHLKRGKTDSYTVYARKSKHIIDDIDRILARHYGFTDGELDFIINYDIQYRMGYNHEDEV